MPSCRPSSWRCSWGCPPSVTPVDDAAQDVIATWSVTLSLAFVGVPFFARAYGSRRRWAALQSAVVALLVAVGLQGYRLVVFLLTLFTTR